MDKGCMKLQTHTSLALVPPVGGARMLVLAVHVSLLNVFPFLLHPEQPEHHVPPPLPT